MTFGPSQGEEGGKSNRGMVWYGSESTQYDVTIELASKNYPKMTPQMLKSVQWFKSYSFGLFRGHTASKSVKSTQNDVTIELA